MLPTLWAEISFRMALPKIETYLLRSQNAPLSISFYSTRYKPTLQSAQSFFLTVFEHAHRIERLSITIPTHGEDLSAWLNQANYINTVFPTLKHLALNEAYQDTPQQDYQFIECWTVPSLRSLYSSNMFSCPLFERGKITSLELFFGAVGEDTYPVVTAGLLDILRSNPQLQHLSLTFSDASHTSCAGPPVSMENVKSLTIGWGSAVPDEPLSQDELDFADNIETIRELSRHIVFPNVVTVKLDLEVKIWEHVPLALQLLLDGQPTFESVTSFQLKLRCWFHPSSTCFLDSIFHKFPNLIDLSIDAADPGFTNFWEAIDFGPLTPKLNSVQMRLKGVFRKDVITQLLDSTDVQNFEITQRSLIGRSIFDKYHHKVNIVWKEEISDDYF